MHKHALRFRVKMGSNVELTGAARLYRAAPMWTAGFAHI